MGRLENKKTPTMRQPHGGAALAEGELPITSNAHSNSTDRADPQSRQKKNGKSRIGPVFRRKVAEGYC
jgi:hypothetical protein